MSRSSNEVVDRYHRKACVTFSIRLMKARDADVIAYIQSVPNKADFLREAVRSLNARGAETLASRFERKCNALPSSEDGMFLDREGFEALVAEARSYAASDLEEDPSSADSPHLLVMRDGTRLRIGNPKQVRYRGYMHEERVVRSGYQSAPPDLGEEGPCAENENAG